MTDTDGWAQWENEVVNGVFPLRRFLGASSHSAVFLTEYKAQKLADAAIKFVPADGLPAEAQLARWSAAAKLSHPNLLRLFEVGRCQLGGRDFLFVVMEYADQTLAQILSKRALGPDEVREILPPTLDALAFLHRNQLLHGQVKPSNFLAVGDHLKLASDTVRPAGNSVSGVARTSAYDPPELKDSGWSTAGDVWSFGMTLVEALTQQTVAWPDQPQETVSLPAAFPAAFAGIVRRCLSQAPANRPTVVELGAPYKSAPQARPQTQSTPAAASPAQESTPQNKTTRNFLKRDLLLPAIAVAFLIALAVWITSKSSGAPPAPSQPSTVPTPSPVAPSSVAPSSVAPSSAAAAPAPVAPAAVARPDPAPSSAASPSSDQRSDPPAGTSAAVLHEVIPDVPTKTLEKIRGRIYVTVRVLVDPSGNVMGTLIESGGSRKYFARVADKAAGEWKFAPADRRNPRVWLLRFTFTRDGVTVRTTAV